jgi:hypothetical protein
LKVYDVRKAHKKVVMQLLAPLSHLKGITSVAEVFRDAEDARKVVQEKVAGEMDNLYVPSHFSIGLKVDEERSLMTVSSKTQIILLIDGLLGMSVRLSMPLVGISGTLLTNLRVGLMGRNHIIERYIQLQLAEYRRIFRSTDEVRPHSFLQHGFALVD